MDREKSIDCQIGAHRWDLDQGMCLSCGERLDDVDLLVMRQIDEGLRAMSPLKKEEEG